MPFTPEQESACWAVDLAIDNLLANRDADPLLQIAALVDALRSTKNTDTLRSWHHLNAKLSDSPVLRIALRRMLLRLFAEKYQITLYTEAGLLPNTGFFSELGRKMRHKLLPELLDKQDIRDCLSLIFTRRSDDEWLAAIPLDERHAFWNMLDLHASDDIDLINKIIMQMLDATLVLSHRIAAMGLEPELLRVCPRLRAEESPFIAMNAEMFAFVGSFRNSLLSDVPVDDGAHLLVLLDQCADVMQRARLASAKAGTSMTLSFLLERLSQHLERLRLLLEVLTVRFRPDAPDELLRSWTNFLRAALAGDRQRNSVRQHFSNLLSLLALRITDNAARTGEHYIALNRADLLSVFRAAAGAGIVIACIALLKILGCNLYLGAFGRAILNSCIYASGLALVYFLHWIIATKQPAMTAATLANSISQTRGRLREIEQFADLVAATFRSQLAAIAGNVAVAFPLAIFIGSTIEFHTGAYLLAADKANNMLIDLNPLHSLALWYAAIAGVWLFVAGLVSGYLDNLAAYRQTGARITQLPWLRRSLGIERAERFGSYLANNAGGLGGNVFFGFMLGLTPLLGYLTGLPIDVRHVALSAANVGYSLSALDFSVDYYTLLAAIVGVILVGMVNLGVSFLLALWVAMRSRKVSFWRVTAVLPVLGRRMLALS